MTRSNKLETRPLVESAAVQRARLLSDRPGEFHFEDTIDYVTFTAGLLRGSHMKFKDVAGDHMSPTTVSNMASGKTRYPRASTLIGITVSLGYEMIIRGGRKQS